MALRIRRVVTAAVAGTIDWTGAIEIVGKALALLTARRN